MADASVGNHCHAEASNWTATMVEVSQIIGILPRRTLVPSFGTGFCRLRCKREIKILEQSTESPDFPFTILEVGPDSRYMQLAYQGPENTPYSVCVFTLIVAFSKNYPFQAPLIEMLTLVKHPSIHEDGTFIFNGGHFNFFRFTGQRARTKSGFVEVLQHLDDKIFNFEQAENDNHHQEEAVEPPLIVQDNHRQEEVVEPPLIIPL